MNISTKINKKTDTDCSVSVLVERQINLSNQFIEGFMEVIKYGANGKRHSNKLKIKDYP